MESFGTNMFCRQIVKQKNLDVLAAMMKKVPFAKMPL